MSKSAPNPEIHGFPCGKGPDEQKCETRRLRDEDCLGFMEDHPSMYRGGMTRPARIAGDSNGRTVIFHLERETARLFKLQRFRLQVGMARISE